MYPTLPEQRQTFQSGANYDGLPEFIFSKPDSGIFIDATNMQPFSQDGHTGGIEKIKGELLFFSQTLDGNGNYECLASASIGGYIVEVWAPNNPFFPSIIRISGNVFLSSLLLNLSPSRPLQWDVKDSPTSLEICISDRTAPPYVFNIEDLISNWSTEKYFTDFDPVKYQVNPNTALDIPVFVELINVGGGGGLPVGQYQYQMRYGNTDGDRTNWSHPTPMIPVMETLSNSSDQYPWVKTYGFPPNPAHVTALAPKLRFRVTNLCNYEFIEIKRISYNNGAGIDYTSNGIVVKRIAVDAAEISVREYIDPQESNVNIPLSQQDESRELAHVQSAGSVKYFNRRLVLGDVTLASKESSIGFETKNDGTNDIHGWPVQDKLFKPGYNDPWNHAYKRSEMRGEKVGYGVAMYDCVGNKGFVTKIPDFKNFQFPNRRDLASSITQDWSYGGCPKASLANQVTGFPSNVGLTHEVFDLNDAIYKSDVCSFKNIIREGALTLTGTKTAIPLVGINQDCDETSAEIETHGAHYHSILNISVSYQPFTPVRQNDPDVTGHNYAVNTKVAKSDIYVLGVPLEFAYPDEVKDYRPTGFGPNYYALGVMFAGVNNFPDWAKSFAVVRTTSAKRVVAQGCAWYSMIKGKFLLIGEENLGGKDGNKVWFYSPDIENGIVSSDTLNDIIESPENYKIQFVSPLGFFSEWYSGERTLDPLQNSGTNRCVDMISYLRMIRDVHSPDSKINPMETAGMGYSGGDGYDYVGYDHWRGAGTNFFTGDADGGDKLFGINSIRRKAEGRGTYLEVTLDQDLYGQVYTGGKQDFDDDNVKNWTEPVYIANIIRVGADIKDEELQKYKQTTHYQKLESIIGKSNGQAGQRYLLVDERWEDVIPAMASDSFGNGADRYVYVKLPNGTVQRWINISYKSAAQKAVIYANISSATPTIHGVYTHNNINNANRFFEVVFSNSSFIPPTDSLILVRYDNDAPIRVFGGDTFVGETLFAPIDKNANADDDAAETQFAWGIGLPYFRFKLNPRYYTINKAGASSNEIQDAEWFTLGFIRQLCVMFAVESRSGIHLAYNSAYPNQFFPLTHYVIRPNRWDRTQNYDNLRVYDPEYKNDYGDGEEDQWKWGGFRFLQQINPDYGIEPPIAFFSKPTVGYVEKRHFPTRYMWSLPEAINVDNATSTRTFPANNSFDIEDAQGAIKLLWAATTSAGENLYAITEKGICMALTKKSILSDLGAGQLGYMGTDQFITGQYWWSKNTGIYHDYWRAALKTSIPITAADGSEIQKQVLFFINNESIYRMIDNNIVDIGRMDYYGRIFNEGISTIDTGIRINSAFDAYKEQFYFRWYDIVNHIQKTFVFSQKNNKWLGLNGFNFDSFTTHGKQMFGHRQGKTYELNKGYVINGQPITSSVIIGFAPEWDKDKEFVRIRINNPKGKPTQINFYKEKNGTIQYTIDQATFGTYYVKNYNGWEAFIGRIKASVDPNRPRMQNRLLLVEIIHNLGSEFVISDVTVSYRKII